jgi:hypothetical protein
MRAFHRITKDHNELRLREQGLQARWSVRMEQVVGRRFACQKTPSGKFPSAPLENGRKVRSVPQDAALLVVVEKMDLLGRRSCDLRMAYQRMEQRRRTASLRPDNDHARKEAEGCRNQPASRHVRVDSSG